MKTTDIPLSSEIADRLFQGKTLSILYRWKYSVGDDYGQTDWAVRELIDENNGYTTEHSATLPSGSR